MKVRTVFKTIIQLAMCSILVFTVAFIGGCKGKAGDAGTSGADGTSVALNDCNNCHHLNSLAVNEFNEIFVASLAGADQTIPGGAVVADRRATLTFDATKLPTGETAQTFVWTRTNGQVATIGTGTSSVLVTLPSITNYKTELARHIKGLIVTDQSGTVLSDRARIVPVNPQNLDEAFSATFKLRVGTASGKFYYTLVKVTESSGEANVENFAAIATGLSNVPVGVPVLLRSISTGTNAWTITSPAGSTVTALNDPTTQFADFKPDVPGQYTASDGKGNTFNIFAGTWKGVIVGQDANHRPLSDPACLGCHVDGGQAPDKFTPWKDSGHAEILTQNINDTASHWTVSGCAPCHSVGFDASTTDNGFDDAVAATGWTFTHGDPNNWTAMLADFPAAARLANIQCENCHGPQDSAAHTSTATAGTAGPRTTLSSDDCGICHGEPLRHARFQQWEDSGHGTYELAVEEAVSGNNSSNNCAGCHSAQGFFVYLAQLQAGNPLRTIATISVNKDTVQPQTCQVCHDPHAQGTTSGEPNTAKVRVVDNTPKLPGGFAATGVGRGAICFICHNSRNGGGSGAFAADAFLHQDGDPQFGSLTGYSGPHEACQGDMVLGYNAYFVGSGNYRSPHSLIIDTCTNCHMEQTLPPALLSYNLAGTNHAFVPSLNICKNCHGANVALGPMLQDKVKSQLEELERAIGDKIISRNTGTIIDEVVDLGSRGSIHVRYNDLATGGTSTVITSIGVASIPGLSVSALGTDDLAKALWNFYLVEQDQSFGVHNPDFTFAVLGGSMRAVTGIPNATVVSNEL
jgi:hypothetical protein